VVNACRSVDGNMKGLVKMQVFLRNRETGQYYSGPNGWNGNSSEAHDFETVESAIELARTQRLADMEVVLHYDDPTCDLVLPFKQEP
jgi:hypothetical protein